MRKALFLTLFLASCSPIGLRNPASLHEGSCFELFSRLLKSEEGLFRYQRTMTLNHYEGFRLFEEIKKGNFQGPFKKLSQRQRKASLINVQEMEGVTRGDGVPYATHPIKLSLLSLKIIGNDSPEAQRTFLYTMIHDVLEEGRGVSPQSYLHLRRELGGPPEVSRAAVILVEPDLSSLKKPEEIKDSMIEVIGYERQITSFSLESGDRALLNASIIDKTINVFDRYFAGLGKEEDFLFNMKWRLAKQGYLLQKMEASAHPEIVDFARKYHELIRQRIGATADEIHDRIAQFEALDQEFGAEIDQIISDSLKEYPF